MAIGVRTTVAGAQGATAAASIALTIPAAVQVGDLMYVVVSAGTAGNTVTISGTGTTGFTNRLALAYNTVANPCGSAVYWRLATAGDTGGAASYTWTLSSSVHWSVCMSVFSGVDTTTVFDGTIQVTRATASATSATHPSITPVQTNDVVVLSSADRFTGNGSSPTYTAPSGTAFAVTDHSTSATTQNGGSTVAWEQLASNAAISGLSTGYAVTTSWNTISDLLLTAAANQTVAPPAATASASAPTPNLAVTAALPAATAAASAPAPTILVAIPPPAATASASAPTPTLAAKLLPPAATASASAPLPTLAASVAPPAATASASSPAPGLNVNVLPPAGTASAGAPVPTVSAGGNQTIAPPAATASASAPAPTITVALAMPAAAATASAPVPTLAAKLLPPAATASASSPIPTLKLALLPPAATASASSPFAALNMALFPPAATASGSAPLPGTVGNRIQVALLTAAATGAGSAPIPLVVTGGTGTTLVTSAMTGYVTVGAHGTPGVGDTALAMVGDTGTTKTGSTGQVRV